MIDFKNLTIKEASELLKKGDLKVIDLANYFLDQIKEKNKDLNAYLEIYEDIKIQSDFAQQIIDEGRGSVLTGIPIGLKDNILIEGKKITASSKVLEGFVANYDASVIQKLKKEGVIFLGRTNMDEFAMGASTENSAFGVTKNPHNLERVSGGSSGGSACIVGGGLSIASLGSDTGGSIRQPASFCGAVGFKPSYGAVSRHGLIAMGSSLDQIGPITRTVEDAEIIFSAINGKDSFDATTIDLEREIKNGKKIGVDFKMLNQDGIDQEIKDNFNQSLEKMKKDGYEIVDIDLKNIDYSLPVYYIVTPAEVSSNMARFDGVKYGKRLEGGNLIEEYLSTRGNLLGREVKRRIMIGTYVLSSGYYDSYYGKATAMRSLIKSDFDKAFEMVDAVAMPTAPTTAFKIGEKSDDPMQMYLADIFTVTANLIGSPAISIPSGFSKDGMPIGFQLVGKFKEDYSLLSIAKDFEKVR